MEGLPGRTRWPRAVATVFGHFRENILNCGVVSSYAVDCGSQVGCGVVGSREP